MWIPLGWGETQYPFKTQRDVYCCAACGRTTYTQHDHPAWSFAYAPRCCAMGMEKTGSEQYDGPETEVQPTEEVSDG